ncbi:hypothetical protein HHI36_005443, partial [Cryptolaemus montrouzieri]
MDKWAPIKIRRTQCKKKWIDRKVRLLQKERDILLNLILKIFKFTDNTADFHEYKMRTKGKKYYEDEINKCGKDSKKMWKVLKEVVSTSREGFSSSKLGDDEFDEAGKLNPFFID